MARLALLLGVASLAAGGSADTIAVNGTVTLHGFDVMKACKWRGTRKVLRVGCTVYGAYAGTPGPADAGYGWVWSVPADAHGMTTGYGFERGTLLLDFGRRGVLTLSLTGKQGPVGAPPTFERAKVRTRGTWTMTKGTACLARRHGTGTYSYTIARAKAGTTFSFASLALTGSIS
jgi:hypothetical protein